MSHRTGKVHRRARRDRLDHLLPQCYLEGFTHQGRLFAFNRHDRRWFECGTRGVAAIRGFYDYAEGAVPEQTPDQAFAELESEFPVIRRQLISTGFSSREKHRVLLLRFADMLRVRSEFYREETIAQNASVGMLKIEEVLEPEPGALGTRLRVAPHVPSSSELTNLSITEMRMELQKGPELLFKMHWSLHFTDDPHSPVVTSDNALLVEGRVEERHQALVDPFTRIYFPICWQACLIGSLNQGAQHLLNFEPSHLNEVRILYRNTSPRLLYSPTKISL